MEKRTEADIRELERQQRAYKLHRKALNALIRKQAREIREARKEVFDVLTWQEKGLFYFSLTAWGACVLILGLSVIFWW